MVCRAELFALELHVRYFLVRTDNLVPYLHHQLKRNVSLLDCDHHVVNSLRSPFNRSVTCCSALPLSCST